MNTTTAAQQRAAAKEFADFWKGKGYEKGQTQPISQVRLALAASAPSAAGH